MVCFFIPTLPGMRPLTGPIHFPIVSRQPLLHKILIIAFDAVQRLKAQAVMVNDHTAFRVDWMPFGGSEQSGLGTGGIGYSIKDMIQEKLVVLNLS